MLMLVTVSGMLYVWCVASPYPPGYVFIVNSRTSRNKSIPPTSVIPILGPSSNFTILSTAVRPHGMPMIQLSDVLAQSYDAALCAWTKLSEPWLEKGSDAWQGQQQGASTHAGCAPLAPLEGAIAERTNLTPAGARGEGSPRVVGRSGDARAPREQAVCGVGAVQPARVQTGAVTVREAHRGRRIQGEGAGLIRELYIGALHVPARRPLNLGTSLLTVHMVFKCTLELKFTMLFVSLNDGTPY